jgi:transposase
MPMTMGLVEEKLEKSPACHSSSSPADMSRYCDSRWGNSMMGQLNRNQSQLFYSFCLEEVVPTDHLVRDIAAVLDLDWVRTELAPYYSPLGRPSIDPVLMIRMLIVGYVFAIRSERMLCREVNVNLAG